MEMRLKIWRIAASEPRTLEFWSENEITRSRRKHHNEHKLGRKLSGFAWNTSAQPLGVLGACKESREEAFKACSDSFKMELLNNGSGVIYINPFKDVVYANIDSSYLVRCLTVDVSRWHRGGKPQIGDRRSFGPRVLALKIQTFDWMMRREVLGQDLDGLILVIGDETRPSRDGHNAIHLMEPSEEQIKRWTQRLGNKAKYNDAAGIDRISNIPIILMAIEGRGRYGKELNGMVRFVNAEWRINKITEGKKLHGIARLMSMLSPRR